MASCAWRLVPMNSTVPPCADRFADELVRAVDVLQGLLQVDDVDAVALGEDEPLHLRVPAPGLVSEMDTCVQHLTHGDDSHEGASFLGAGAAGRLGSCGRSFGLSPPVG